MPMRLDDLVGRRFGRWLVLSRLPNVKTKTRWLCDVKKVREILDALSVGERKSVLAKRYGISRTHVHAIGKRTTWTDLSVG